MLGVQRHQEDNARRLQNTKIPIITTTTTIKSACLVGLSNELHFSFRKMKKIIALNPKYSILVLIGIKCNS